ncbi:hypothetical protein D3H64_03775 [Atopobacter sp. AH10]|uniref:hypothetical protein n=1 Tax=Atopobacter sp. AH10 TaxID=2315861 RepID=UPI000EF20CB6|nr:hypothetical protein [Atopobacter sp. AH10]RLK63555.1 hypothetical protein D3H64_03775 [Atopobacter sp. AH10]
MKNSYPRLCGGTFFVLLLRAKRTKAKKDIRKYSANGITNPEFLKGLITIFDSSYYEPSGSSLETNTSRYKKCEISKADCLPFDDNALITAFDRQIKEDYYTLLVRMKELLDYFLTIDKAPKIDELVYGILNLIINDYSINQDDIFYALPNGTGIIKKDLISTLDINLYSLILGVWHFILTSRKDNKIGASTIKSWHEEPLEKGEAHIFTSSIGSTYHLDIKISTLIEQNESVEREISDEVNKDFFEEPEIEILDSVDTNETSQHQENKQPTINNQFIFNQSGSGVNIGQVTNVIIKNGKVVDAE